MKTCRNGHEVIIGVNSYTEKNRPSIRCKTCLMKKMELNKSTRNKKLDEWMIQRIKKLRSEGITYSVIQQRLGISHALISQVVNSDLVIRAKNRYQAKMARLRNEHET